MDIVKSVSDALELPYDTMLNIPKIIMLGKYRLCVENYSVLIEYKSDNIKLKHKTAIIEVYGKNLEIKSIGENHIEICGIIEGVKLI